MISPPQERVRLAAKSYKGRKPSLTKERVEEIANGVMAGEQRPDRRLSTGSVADWCSAIGGRWGEQFPGNGYSHGTLSTVTLFGTEDLLRFGCPTES
jgi:hypothetical protein